MQQDVLARLIDHWKADLHGTYNTWFLREERLKNFRSIRRGIAQVVRDIENGSFGNAYRGSSLETVVGSVPSSARSSRAPTTPSCGSPSFASPTST